VIAESDTQYLTAGSGFTLHFAPRSGDPRRRVEILAVEEGRFVKGQWLPGRRLNGDETANGTEVRLKDAQPVVRRVTVCAYE
jgi:hypothetical protein